MTITDTWEVLSTTACLVQNKASDRNSILVKYNATTPTDTNNTILIEHEEVIMLPAPVSGSIYVKKFDDRDADIGITVVGV